VSTPLHSESAKRLNKWRIIDPEFFDRVLHVFPEIGVQARYWDEYDSQAQVAQYPETWRGCLHILDHFPPGSTREDARERLREFKVMSQKQPDSYTPKLLLRKLASGTVKRVIMGSRKEA
jgi:NADH:ubiquinone oxidoreductase subunit